MNTPTRFITLLGLMLTVFGGALWQMRDSHLREVDTMLSNLRTDRGELLDRLLGLTGESLKNFANDYTYWDEMVTFVHSGDPQWGEQNLTTSLPTFNANGVWVLRTDGIQVFSAIRDLANSYQALPLPATAVVESLAKKPFQHFFLWTEAGLMEFRAAPIQPTADSARTSPPQGWLFVARLWNERQLAPLSRALESEVVVSPSTASLPAESIGHSVQFHRELPDWRGNPTARLDARYVAAALNLIVDHHDDDMLVFIIFGGATLLLSVIGVSRWVVLPLRRLEASLASSSPEPLTPLLQRADEFGRLADLVEHSFAQRRALEHEVNERRSIEAALRQSQEALQSMANLKGRLSRDLHDGVIQSIYAAGLGLEGVRNVLRADPADANRRIDACQASLNQTLRDVRSFITGLDPSDQERTPLDQSLRALISTLQALYPMEIKVEVSAGISRLRQREEIHLLQILRESISNAYRHGAASCVQIRFDPTGEIPTLEISDNGGGFDVVQASQSGRAGLANLAARADEINALLEISSSLGKGTRIALRFASR